MTNDSPGSAVVSRLVPTLAQWRLAIFALFLLCGVTFASWASRLPAVKAALGIDDFEIGVLLFAMGAGSLVGLTLANIMVARWGARRGLVTTIITLGVSLSLVAAGVQIWGSYALVTIALVVMGCAFAATDVMINVEAAAVERKTGRTLMPLFHALFSVGTVVGAGVGILMAQWNIAPGWHFWVVAALAVAGGLWALRFVPAHEQVTADAETAPTTRRERVAAALAVWREPRIYAIGLVILGMAFAEGSASDWLAIALVDGHGQDEATGALALTIFSVSMTVFRILGGPLVDRFGRVWTLRILSVLAATGLVTFILAPSVPVAFIGVALWGAGASLGFPLGMSAAADDPQTAAASVSAAATIGYTAFLCGPPLLGWISHQIGILPTLWIIVALIAMSGLASGAARPRAGSTLGAGRH